MKRPTIVMTCRWCGLFFNRRRKQSMCSRLCAAANARAAARAQRERLLVRCIAAQRRALEIVNSGTHDDAVRVKDALRMPLARRVYELERMVAQ